MPYWGNNIGWINFVWSFQSASFLVILKCIIGMTRHKNQGKFLLPFDQKYLQIFKET